MKIDQQRAAFEAWADDALVCTFIKNAHGDYVDRLVADEWQRWQLRTGQSENQAAQRALPTPTCH